MPHASSDRQKLCLIAPSHELAGYGLSIKSNCSIHTSSIVKSVLHNFNHCYLHTKMDRHTLNLKQPQFNFHMTTKMENLEVDVPQNSEH